MEDWKFWWTFLTLQRYYPYDHVLHKNNCTQLLQITCWIGVKVFRRFWRDFTLAFKSQVTQKCCKAGHSNWTLQVDHMSMGGATFCTLKEAFGTDNLRLLETHEGLWSEPKFKRNLGHWIGSGIAPYPPITLGVLLIDKFHINPLLVGFWNTTLR